MSLSVPVILHGVNSQAPGQKPGQRSGQKPGQKYRKNPFQYVRSEQPVCKFDTFLFCMKNGLLAHAKIPLV